MKHTGWLLLILLVFAGRTFAQDDGPAIVDTALQTAADACTALAGPVC